MVSKVIQSDWFGLCLTCFLLFSIGDGIHSDRESTRSEWLSIQISLALVVTWLIVKSLSRSSARGRVNIREDTTQDEL